MATKIQDKNILYSFLRPWVDGYFRHSYRHCRYEGKEHIPTDGMIIYAPNHQNGLMDALAVLAIDRKPKVFVARADIFRKPRIAAILHWLKIMPIRRVRDGLDEVRHNDETMERAVDVLHDGVPFCILPEGTHRRKHALLPLQKGIFHIALRAMETSDKPLYIVPVGLDYADWYHQWSDLTVRIGKPMDMRAFVASRGDLTEPQLINAMREELSGRMKELFPCVEDDADYEENWAKKEKALGRHRCAMPRWLLGMLLVLCSPLALVSGVVTLSLWMVPVAIRKKVKDVAFRLAIQYVWTWLLLPLLVWVQLPFWMFIREYGYWIRKFRV